MNGHQSRHPYPWGMGIRWVIAWMPGASICRGHRVSHQSRMPGGSLGCRGHLVMPGASTKQLHKKTASLRFGWIASETLEEKRKSVTTVRFDWEILRPLLPARFEEERLLAAGIAAEKWTLTDAELVALRIRRERLDCWLLHRSRLESDCICLPIFTVSYLYQKFSGKINLAYIIVVLGHGLKRTSVKLDLVRTITDSVFISYDYCTPLILC